jgi:hypothetical protein
MKIYDLYGFPDNNIEEVVGTLEGALKIKFEAHTSDYVGNHYTYGELIHENFQLKPNREPDGEWAEEKYKEMGLLLYIGRTQRADELKELLTKNVPRIVFLEREEL